MSAAPSATKAPRRDTLNLRIPPEERNLIDRAAEAAGKTRTDFILSAARRAAEDTLLDRAILSVSPEAYAEFLARLDAPAQSNERLRKTMQTPAPWTKA
ncbi:DUF1778 domain-containing protein [Zoogloea sp.]|uniref:type II toxin-antitoxin system TacA family antitoxin n=1 Tax=Zoogloea sp. TaxID=49181 RepID=UPI0035B23DC8|nr:DUF1778 domain-containing protein [Rhodocyclales bacterium]